MMQPIHQKIVFGQRSAVRLVAFLIITLVMAGASAQEKPTTGYAQVKGLKMYYEVHGTGKPLLLLHGAFGTVEGWGSVLPTLAKDHKVIAVELRGHGRTAGYDKPFSTEGMADDVAALLKEIKIARTDVFGYSMGGEVAFALAVHHPGVVGKLATLGSAAGPMSQTYEKSAYEQFLLIKPETFSFPQLRDPYAKVAPDPSKWPDLVRGIIEMERNSKPYTPEQLKAIKSPTLLMLGDREGIRIERLVELRKTIPNAQLAVFPNADHFLIFMNPAKILDTLIPFLDAP